ncbi:hypothetical protein AJ79_01841 [Helicocarpus griseus UAMH5409]|uniref:D-lactate dehydrogenase n=1 Tax=Helicocarpus griseus UAMH5409 TaxID=1447875 RepID=A0A2B7Y615_9EURO|nr:hypothetical protein AJ79_01841 [Helicocarpus griseus UAMH5409]
MKIAVFSTQPYDRKFLRQANTTFNHELDFFEARLEIKTAVIAAGFPIVCVFVNDDVSAQVIKTLAQNGTKMIALRCAGFNNVDLDAAKANNITVARVPRYSPYAVAEYTVGMFLSLDRKIHRAWDRVREDNFNLNGLVGRDLHGKTVGVIGTGHIGSLVAKAFSGFGCNVIAHDAVPNSELQKIGIPYHGRDEVLRNSDVLCLHTPLTPETKHLINAQTIKTLKDGVVIVNTGRGALIDTAALIPALENGKVRGAALDVYENEVNLFFKDMSEKIVRDPVFQRLITFPNVLVTGHQAYFTEEALHSICHTTLNNVAQFRDGKVDPSVLV